MAPYQYAGNSPMSAHDFWQHHRVRSTLEILRQRLRIIADLLPVMEADARAVEDIQNELQDMGQQLGMLSLYLEDPPTYFQADRIWL